MIYRTSQECAEQVEGVGEATCIQGFGGDSGGKDNSDDLGVDGRIILQWIFKQWDVGAWTGLMWLGIGTNVVLL